jgi:hypothetical protein
LKKTSALSLMRSSRQSRLAPRATTSSASRFPRPWVRASRSIRRRLALNQVYPDFCPVTDFRLFGAGNSGIKPGTPVRDCRWLSLNHFSLHEMGESRISFDARKCGDSVRTSACLVPDPVKRGRAGDRILERRLGSPLISCGKGKPTGLCFAVQSTGDRQWKERKNANSSRS